MPGDPAVDVVQLGRLSTDTMAVSMSHEAEDEELAALLGRAQQGDPVAFDRLVLALQGPLTGFLRARGAADAEDLANEVLVRVFSGIVGFDGNVAQFRAWVFRIARNLVVDERRRAGRRPDTVPTAPDGLPEASAPSAEPDHLDEVERVEGLLARVTADQREVLLLRVVAGLSVEETAQVLGRRPGAVRALQHRALHTLRQQVTRKP